MSRLIDADALIDDIKNNLWCWTSVNGITSQTVLKQTITDILNMPTIEPQRMRGRWETIDGWDGDEVYRCSECGEEFVLIDGTPKENGYHFCPNCGADMRETE